MQVRPLLIGLPIVLAATGLSAAPAFAQDDGTAPATPAGPADPAADRTSVTVGVGGVYMPDYEGSNFVLAMAAMPATAQTSPTPPPSLPAAPPVPTAPQFAPIPAPDYTTDAAWLCRPGRQDACAVDQEEMDETRAPFPAWRHIATGPTWNIPTASLSSISAAR